MTMEGDGMIRTGTGDVRIEIDGANSGEIRFHTNATNEITPAAVVSRILFGDYPGVSLYSGDAGGDEYWFACTVIGLELTNEDRTENYLSVGKTIGSFAGQVVSQLANNDPSNPGFSVGGYSSGLYAPAYNEVALSANGNMVLHCDGTTFVAPDVYSAGQSGSANVVVDSDGTMHRIASASKYKQKVADASALLVDIVLEPVEYWTKVRDGEGKKVGRWDNRHTFGLIADGIAAQEHDLGVWEDGEIEDYDTRGVIAVLAAKMNRMEGRWQALVDAGLVA